jgi:DNA-binding LacI/PurR family transcriptional regulator
VETPEGLHELLERLFRSTPPTALIVDESMHFIATMHYLLCRNIQVPEQVSLVSADDAFLLAWCHPAVAHMQWDAAPIIRRVVRWVNAVKKGRADRKTINFPAVFIPGGSVGPVAKP